MKNTNKILVGLTAISAIAVAPAAFGQASAVTAPVGYRTETVKASSFNLLASNLSNAVSAAGQVSGEAANVITDANADFAAAGVGSGYFVQITGGAGAGWATEVTAADANNLTTLDDLSTVIDTTSTYEVRRSQTVTDLFGATNSAGLAGGNNGVTGADVIWIPNGSGGFTRAYYNAVAGGGFGAIGVGWKTTTGGNTDAASTPVYFTDAVFIQRVAATDLDVVFTGHVITSDSVTAIGNGFNFVSRVLPVAMTLAESGLENDLDQGNTNAAAADIIWVPNDAGGYDRFFYNGTAGAGFGALSVGWKGTASGNTDQATAELRSGMAIDRKDHGATNITLRIPAGLDI